MIIVSVLQQATEISPMYLANSMIKELKNSISPCDTLFLVKPLLTFTDGQSGENVDSLTTIYLSVIKCQSDDTLKEGPRKTCSNACTRRPLSTNIVL